MDGSRKLVSQISLTKGVAQSRGNRKSKIVTVPTLTLTLCPYTCWELIKLVK